jgi:Putative zinc-finger
MNCDDVFDALTDPALSPGDSAELEAHLADCPRCRQLREVLEPARSLLCGELPIERLPGQQLPYESGTFGETKSLLTVESVGMAEAIASQLAASGRKSLPPRWSLVNPRFLAVVRGTALVVFGAVAVYCLAPRDRENDLHSIPALVPAPSSAKTCTRMDLQRRNANSRNAQQVVLTCVACHMKDGGPQRPPAASSGFWPYRRSRPSIRLAVSETGRAYCFRGDRSEPDEKLIS